MRTAHAPAPRSVLILVASSAVALAACSSFDTKHSPQAPDAYYDEASTGTSTTDAGSTADAGDGLPGETEQQLFLRPIATETHVFVANESRDTLTRVTVPSLQVITPPTGDQPAVVTASPDGATAVVFAAGSDEVDVIDTETFATSSVSVRPNLNWMEMSPDGRFVIVYNDEDADTPNTGSGAQSYNEISLVDVDNLRHWPMVVGFNPRQVQFTDDSTTAVVVSDAYLAVIDLTADDPSPTRIAIAQDVVNPPLAEEVAVTPDGSYAFVRQLDASDLVLVDLQTNEVDRLDIGTSLTDLDLTPDGSQAVAVARAAGELWIFDVADPFQPATVLDLPTEAILGSIVMASDGARGLLYSTVSGLSRYASWERDTNDIVVHGLVKPVQSIAISPDGATALVVHTLDNGSEVDNTSSFYNRYALTMVDLTDFFSNPLLLTGEVLDLSQSDDGSLGYLVMKGQPWLEILHYDSLLYDEIELKSEPEHVGVLPNSTTAWVSQQHDLGRISFYNPDDQTLQTLTGFELNSGIEH
ncbi:MAG: hypothetical protein GXP62_12920 [Oligoflexia bacterium]|nr:hypothetical protein [Oligoflexia bacterium]